MDERSLDEPMEEQEDHPHLKFFIFAGAILTIILVVIFLFVLNKFSPITEQELLIGKTLKLEKGEKIDFLINEDEEHTLTVDSVAVDSVIISIESEKIILALKIGEEKKVDINFDGKEDLQIKLIKIENGKPSLAIKKIEATLDSTLQDILSIDDEKSCVEIGGVICDANQQCTKGFEEVRGEECCLGDCFSLEVNQNNLSTNESSEETCMEDWACGEWSSCVQSLQTRNCSDNNVCSTEEDKPIISRSCTETPEPSGICSDTDAKEISDRIIDAIKNKDELRFEEICESYGWPCGGWELFGFEEVYNISSASISNEEKFDRKWVVYRMNGPIISMQFIFNLSDSTCFHFNTQYSYAPK